MTFTAGEQEYLQAQRLGRIGTASSGGEPDVAPVGYRLNGDVIEIGGIDIANTRKYVNIERTGRASFVVDDLASIEPWRPRGVKMTGAAHIETVDGGKVLRLRADTIWSWGINPDAEKHHAGMIEKRAAQATGANN